MQHTDEQFLLWLDGATFAHGGRNCGAARHPGQETQFAKASKDRSGCDVRIWNFVSGYTKVHLTIAGLLTPQRVCIASLVQLIQAIQLDTSSLDLWWTATPQTISAVIEINLGHFSSGQNIISFKWS